MNEIMQYVSSVTFVKVIEFVGTIAFAISGVRLAAAKEFDWFGALVVGFVTAIGGGTVRDLLLDVTPFWMLNPVYLVCSMIGLVVVIIFSKQLVRLDTPFFIFDTIGLALFVVVGIE
ncbi:MAG: TRIC cation channel family protein, partial [Tannerella sp.]|nr:TRIC cation channel family protein [Tannerella sp.]